MKPNPTLILLISLVLLGQTAIAQKITVSGKVTDIETQEPLVFASVGIKGKNISTITNLQGEFDFHIPIDFKNEILVVSMLGYNNFESPIWSMLEPKPFSITMKKSTTVLKELTVKDSLTGNDILFNALQRIEQNYPMKPFMLEGFYRDVKKVGGTHISLLEAAVKIFDENYAEPRDKYKLRERVQLLEVRRSLGYEHPLTRYFDQSNLLKDLLLDNGIRYRTIIPNDGVYYKFIREKDSYYNEHDVFVITHAKYFSMKIFIDKDDFSIIHIDYEDYPTTKGEAILDKNRNILSRYAGTKQVIDFKRISGKMYLNYITTRVKVNWYDITTKEFKFETELIQELLINEVSVNTRERITPGETMKTYGLQYQDLPYNKTFWDNYNVIKETPLDAKVREDIERAGPLEKQFEGKN